ncbi:MAG: hypothetical protein C0506_02860 [Anaerolinea sp.]|nr:hypothetical protein [Anaerolinea sp.]
MYPIAKAYTRAVENDDGAHPVQLAADCIPAQLIDRGLLTTAKDLYDYSVCAYDASDTPLMLSDPVGVAHWIIFENVYFRGDHGCHPENADISKAVRAGFREKPGRNDQRRAKELWTVVSGLWGTPPTADSPR